MKWAWLLVAVCLVASCAKKNDLVGVWISEPDVLGFKATSESEIFDDGRFRTITRLGEQGAGELLVTDSGRWRLIPPNKVKWTLEDIQYTINSPKSGVRTAQILQRMNAQKAKIIADFNKEPADVIDWKNPNLFTLKGRERMDVYKRKQ